MQKRNEIIAIVDKAEYQKLMNYISREDPHAFITVYTVSDIRYQPKRQHEECDTTVVKGGNIHGNLR